MSLSFYSFSVLFFKKFWNSWTKLLLKFPSALKLYDSKIYDYAFNSKISKPCFNIKNLSQLKIQFTDRVLKLIDCIKYYMLTAPGGWGC